MRLYLLLKLVALLQTPLRAGVPVMGLVQIWAAAAAAAAVAVAAAAAAAAVVLVQFRQWLLWAGCFEESGFAVVAAVAAVVYSADAAAGPVEYHQLLQGLDVSQTVPDHLIVAAAQYGPEGAAVAVVY